MNASPLSPPSETSMSMSLFNEEAEVEEEPR